MKKNSYLIVGDINVDLIFKGVQAPPVMGQEIFVPSMDLCLGGSAANTASALGKLGTRSYLWTTIAQDEFGAILLRLLHEYGVEIDYIQHNGNKKTGVSIALTNHQDRSFVSYRGTNEDLDFNQIQDRDIAEHSYLHVSGFNWKKNFGGYLGLFQRAKRLGVRTSLDLGWTEFDTYRNRLLELLPYVDYFFPNEMEAFALTQSSDISTALKCLSKKTEVPVITLGSKGAITLWQGKEYFQPSFHVESIDSVGAGDSFDAGFLWAIGQGIFPPEALKIANACGALTTTGVGGAGAAPSLEELSGFLKVQEQS